MWCNLVARIAWADEEPFKSDIPDINLYTKLISYHRKITMPDLHKASFEFAQDGNTMGTTSETEGLTVDLEYQLPGDEPFLVLRTNGWSADDPEEISKLLQKCINAVKQI